MSDCFRLAAVGPYPERRDDASLFLDKLASTAKVMVRDVFRRDASALDRAVGLVNQCGKSLDRLDPAALSREVQPLRQELVRQGFTDELVARSFALARAAAEQVLGMRHYDEQLKGGWVMLNGNLAEMETGEGKTLTATLPACTVALAGLPVHIITVNDYLAERDAELMAPLYEALGLRVGVVTESSSPAERRRAYACDITYCTNKQVAFDYLRDRIARNNKTGTAHLQLDRLRGDSDRQEPLLLRGLCFAIVDEADSVLVDEAGTPLIISKSRNSTAQQSIYTDALAIARQLQETKHYALQQRAGKREVAITEQGQDCIKELAAEKTGVWRGARRRDYLLGQALTALHLHVRDKHYLVQDNSVQIIDEHTGRRMPDRSWERGLHQMVECKEGCEITAERETLARISYQRFFRRYVRLSGMTGTAREVSSELRTVYNLGVVRIPTHKPIRRVQTGFRLYATEKEKWCAVISHVGELARSGRPILIGTRSVCVSEVLSELLTAAELPHQTLNARQDQNEAEVVSGAGALGTITVATNMAGRGTDILLGPEVAGLGGLHVIATELNDATRIDRQLFGRCGRQGDRGSYEVIASLEGTIFEDVYCARILRFFGRFIDPKGALQGSAARMIAGIAQWMIGRRQYQGRRTLLSMDEKLNELLAFSGSGE